MQKIITLFQRNYGGDRQVRDEVVPGAEWVLAGEGVATRKWEGACCRIKDGILWKRYEGKTPPPGFEPAQDLDSVTGHSAGWVPCKVDDPADKYFNEGFEVLCKYYDGNPREGTYELVGPKINGNKDKFSQHALVQHGKSEHPDAPRTFEGLRQYFAENDIEGIVWHHPDGRMVKLKKKDYGLKR